MKHGMSFWQLFSYAYDKFYTLLYQLKNNFYILDQEKDEETIKKISVMGDSQVVQCFAVLLTE